MAINPVSFTEKVIRNFLRYQLTTYPFSDPALYSQMKKLLSFDETRHTPLFKGPYVSLSQAFKEGASVDAMISEEILHPHMKNLIPHPNLYGHQEKAIKSIKSGKTTLVSTGTGSGKTECFLYPIISRCLELRDKNETEGITAVLVYPMNALAEDQLSRLRGLLAGTGIAFGMYVGKTPEKESDVSGVRLSQGASRKDYNQQLKRVQKERRKEAVHPFEERCSREMMRENGKQPRILLTNVKQLELLLTRGKDIELFDNAMLDFIVFDEAHTFKGAQGAETACLVRRLRSFCGRGASETVCIATSATIADPRKGGYAKGAEFASRFFGVNEKDVELIGEEHTPEVWSDNRSIPDAFPSDDSDHLKEILKYVDKEVETNSELAKAFEDATGLKINPSRWREDLYNHLSRNELVFQLSEILTRPRELHDVLKELKERTGRDVSEEEVLAWLALGAASRKEDRPLLRPVIHGFIRGVGGAMVSFPEDQEGLKLWLSSGGEVKDYLLPILTCTICGQHYFEHYVAGLRFYGNELDGGEVYEGGRLWRTLTKANGGNRIILLDKKIGDDDEENENPAKTSPVFFCRTCGALHSDDFERCGSCGLSDSFVKLFAVQQKEDKLGLLTSCISCRARGRIANGRYRDPAKPVRAVTVSDVHVLSQDIVHHSERRRLLIFADNRQDAAFQAGWMRDHARRFRLRALMAERINQSPVSIGDLTAFMDNYLDNDNNLSMALIPEVWNVSRKETAGQYHADERKKFLRISVLRELVTAMKQRQGLEPWGRMKVNYLGLDETTSFIQKHASTMGVSPHDLVEGIAGLLDQIRRAYHLSDQELGIFSRIWDSGDREIQRGYLPELPGVPKGLKLRKESSDSKRWITSWISERGRSGVQHAVKAWGVEQDKLNDFIEELWEFLTDDLKLLVPVTLVGQKGNALPNCPGVFQIDGDRIQMALNKGLWLCNKCRRTRVRSSPNNRCIAYNCNGSLEFEKENPDNYDLEVLDSGFEMIRPREHSAQVPAGEREKIELAFKSPTSQAVNALVCTPTLELGVDIGALDAVLMRNVPPLPSNYWQRVGRAGRRHRMAVDLTYCRSVSHDRVYFEEPLKMLDGIVKPPSFNMKNSRMVEKHVHATILTRLNQLTRSDSSLSDRDREELRSVLLRVFPSTIKIYLFDEQNHIRSEVFDVSTLTTMCTKHENNLLDYVKDVFSQGWPQVDKVVVEEDILKRYIRDTGEKLSEVIQRLKHRLDWAMDQKNRLNDLSRQIGTLDSADDALFARCDVLIKRYKGELKRRRKEAEGYDDINTMGVLAAEGFLPGYGLETGSILGTAHVPPSERQAREFTLSRPSSIAIREYMPGNLIYANNHKFVARYFHLSAGEKYGSPDIGKPVYFEVDTTSQAIREFGRRNESSDYNVTTANIGGTNLRAVPISDVDLTHVSHITDDEDFRFQMPVAIYGYELNRHNGGKGYRWGNRDLQFRRNIHFRLVNVGAVQTIEAGSTIGYPVCLVCGQSRSPFASEKELAHFSDSHRDRCGQEIEPTGFFANIVADSIVLPGCKNRDEAYSVLESLRTGAALVLEMEPDDLQILIIGHSGQEEVDAYLYDPMPGGSGLLDQIINQFDVVHDAAYQIVSNCPSNCEKGCIDCLWTYRNAFFHKHLDRKLAKDFLECQGNEIEFAFDIPPKLPSGEEKEPSKAVNECEEQLGKMLHKAGFPDPQWHHQIQLGKGIGSTSPDCFYVGDDEIDPGTCIYLDGLSEHIHGNPRTQRQDKIIREKLRSTGYEVIEIAASDLDDRGAMTRYFYKLGKIIIGKDHAQKIKDNQNWFGDKENSSP